ncbi:MAG: hypothetical protein ACOY5W_01125 [Pseudomonadota bacterium]
MESKGHYKALEAYSKFPEELEYFYWGDDDDETEQRDMSWLGNDEQKIALFDSGVEALYEAAYADLKRLSIEVDGLINTKLGSTMSIERAHPKEKWMCRDLYWKVWRKRGRRPSSINFQFGLFFDIQEGEYCVSPWVYVRGGRSKEIDLKRILGNGSRMGKDAGFSPGTVVLGNKSIVVANIIKDHRKSAALLAKSFVDVNSKTWGKVLDLAYG